MRLVTKKSVEEVRQTLFSPLSKAGNTNRLWTEVAPTWCTLSEMRLFSKLIEHKPAGVFKQQHLGLLTDYLNNIYEDEVFDFEEYLSPEDLAAMKKRREIERQKGDEVMRFEPVYRIRPTVQQVSQKLSELYDMNTIELYEDNPDWLEKSSDFFLPEGEFSELIQEQESRIFAAPPLEMKTPRHSSGAPPAKKRRRRQSTDSGSRASSISKHDAN